jgi:F0F1-type ATP synthase gamma subunit
MLSNVSDRIEEARRKIEALSKGHKGKMVIVKPHHRWGNTIEEAKELYANPELAEAKAVVEEIFKDL